MTGNIGRLSAEGSEGIIIGPNKERYKFTEILTDVKVGDYVDFEVDKDGKAYDICYSKKTSAEIFGGIPEEGNIKGNGTMAAIGAGLAGLFFIPILGWIAAIAGVIIELIAVKRLANNANEPKIFTNLLWSVILILAAGAVGAVVFTTGLAIGGFGMSGGQLGVSSFSSLGVFSVLGILVTLGMMLVGVIKHFSALSSLSAIYGSPALKWAAISYIVSALTMIIGIGIIFTFLTAILKVVGYLNLKQK